MNSPSKAAPPDAPLILEIKGASLDDGPGIRTVVFIKGCPLSCTWCHNPESKAVGQELSFDAGKCIRCGECLRVCGEGAVTPGQGPDRSLCSLCLACTEVCPAKALEPVGRAMAPEEVVETVARDLPFFDASGGGVTLSGGEPTLFPTFCGDLLRQFKARGMHTLLETCGHFSWSAFESHILDHTDTVYCDIKLMSPEAHRHHCGVSNSNILSNLEKLLTLHRSGALDVLPRIPLVPGITATVENITAIADHLNALGAHTVQVLPYNPLWHGKIKKMGGDGAASSESLGRFMDNGEVKHWRGYFEERGLTTL
ncbi:glycyl-radical enzyme activating protein [Desulfoluna spongiiphila]|uniref:glycyl-radical enzyme activating protein n=1 Tax=Desulfoluna spongiiphila TaxID=419481 RepID=UPI0012570369|nr:glycyl-radical enzyme activating protein [Desulfoluna spongiiphila]VVS95664.1 aldolase-type tim barrel [Desulfoluna spongiiphila]